MKKETREKLYKIGEVAEILGVHEDTLRNWEREGFVVPERIGKRKDRRYTAEMIGEIREKGLVSDLAKKIPANKKKLPEYTKDELVKELQILKKQKKYGLVWEDHTEEVVERCKTEAPILVAIKDKQIKDKDKNKPTNILIEGDNYHALQVLNYTHRGKIDVIYIDPPYNTGAKDWKYNNDYVDDNDTYRHSKWLSMMHNRLNATKKLLTKNGVLICAIDKYEQATLSLLLSDVFPGYEITCITMIHNPAGTQGNNFSYTNEYLFFVFPQDGVYINKTKREDALVSAFRDWGTISLRSQAKTCFYPIIVKGDKIVKFGDICSDDFHPSSSNIKQSDGTIHIFPIDKKGVERKWVFSRGSVEEIKEQLHCKNIDGEISVFRTKNETNYKTVWDDKRYYANIYGSKLLNQIIDSNFPFPKSLHAVTDSIRAVIHRKNATILDFFAGSGTTGHAVLELNKEDDGNRKFILCTNNEFGIEDEKKIMEKYGINRKEFEQEVNKKTKRWYEWREEYGIASTATLPRIKNNIKGYSKPNGGKITGFGGSLEYFKTEFVDVKNIDKVSDKKKLEFTYEAGQMIALKEDAFKEVVKNKFYQIFTDEKDKFVGIYFRENLDKLAEMEKKILGKKNVRLYLFSYGVNDFKKDYTEYKNVTVKDIPEPILKIYKRLNN